MKYKLVSKLEPFTREGYYQTPENMIIYSRGRMDYRLIRDGGYDKNIPVKYELTGAIDIMRPSGWKMSMWHKRQKT